MQQTPHRAPSPDGPRRRRRLSAIALATLGAVCSSVDVWVIVNALLPDLQAICAPAVTLQSVAAALGYALVAVLASRMPARIDPRAMSVLSALLIAGGTALWAAATRIGSGAGALAGVCIAHFGGSWARILVGVALCALGNKRDLAVAVVLGETVGALLRCVLPLDLPFETMLAVAAFVEFAMLAAGHVGSARFMRGASADQAPVDLGTTNPDSFVGPSHRLFVLIAFFELIHGVSLAERAATSLPAVNMAVVVLLAAGVAWTALRRAGRWEDTLLYMAALLMLAGFVLRPLSPVEAALSSTLSFAGAAFSWMMIWTVFASVGMCNPAGALAALGAGYTMQALGLEAGSVLGRLSLASPAGSESAANVINTLVVVAFIGYLLIELHGFSFSAAFAGIVPVEPLKTIDESNERIARRCSALAESHGLSQRERDVLDLLALGRNGREIQDRLVVSRNTVKTHVRHIYRKLGVHSQQELIDMVSGMR